MQCLLQVEDLEPTGTRISKLYENTQERTHFTR